MYRWGAIPSFSVRPSVGAAGILIALFWASALLAQEASNTQIDKAPDGSDLCNYSENSGEFPEQVQGKVHSYSCYTARWIDRLFGSKYDFDEDAVNGMMSVGFLWTEFDGLDPKVRFRLDAPLPNLDNRVRAFLGRVEEDAEIRGTQPTDQTAFQDGIEETERSWLLGLGYNPNPDRRQGFDYSLGIRLRASPDPYARIRYRYYRDLDEQRRLKFIQTTFWRRDEGFGTTSNLDMDWDLNSGNILRWETIGTVSEDTEGLNWWSGTTWYRHLGGDAAIALLGFVRGETDQPVGLQEYGFRLTWRHPFKRDWMYLEYGPSITWPRERKEEKRELSLGVGLRWEVQFGDYRP